MLCYSNTAQYIHNGLQFFFNQINAKRRKYKCYCILKNLNLKKQLNFNVKIKIKVDKIFPSLKKSFMWNKIYSNSQFED